MKKLALLSVLLGLNTGLAPAHADAACPSDLIRSFLGRWQGKALLIPAQGPQQQSGTQDEFAVIDCQSFEVKINYLDSAGHVARTLDLKASSNASGNASENASGNASGSTSSSASDGDTSGQVGLFSVSGSILEGKNVSPMTGTFRVIQDGTLLGSFSGAIGGQPAYLNELMNSTTFPNGDKQLVRTVQMFKGDRGGAYLGTRVVNDAQVQQ